MLCRIFFYAFNKSLFPGISFYNWLQIIKGGIRFDLAAMFYFNAAFIILSLLPLPFREGKQYQLFIKIIFFVTNGLAILLNAIDFIYFRFTLRRTTRTVFAEFAHETNGAGLAGRFFIDYWYVAVTFTALILAMIWLYNRVLIKSPVGKKGWLFYTTSILALPIAILLAVGGIRGDFKYSTRPITVSNAGAYVSKPHEMYLVLNTPFCMVRTWTVKKLEPLHYFTDKEVETIYTPVHTPQKDSTALFQKKNIVVIILESFGQEAVGAYNHDLDKGLYKGFTPFLDSLIGVSRTYRNSFANGRKSIDALPSILAGIPNGIDPFVLTPYSSNKINSLPQLLKQEGYYTAFFHGAPNGSMGFDALMKLMGVEHYYGKNEYNNDADFDGLWGIWDEPFFQFFESKLNEISQPFMCSIFSTSSHHPFKVPKPYEGVFKKGPLPVLECISYTDMALKKFFEKAQKQPWFNNTLFVISADHATISYHPEYQNAWGDVAIPIILYAPGDTTLRGMENGYIQQIDIMPTVLHYMHYNKPFVAYGGNALDKSRMQFSVCYNGGYRWLEGDYLLFFDGTKSSSLFNFKTDRGFKNNLLGKEIHIATTMERHLKAFMQQYNNRLNENRLTVNP